MKIQHSEKEMNKIILKILKMCKSEDKSFQVPPPSPPLHFPKSGKASPTSHLLPASQDKDSYPSPCK